MSQLSYATRGNLDYLEALFEKYLKNPHSLSKEWQMFFNGMELGKGQSPFKDSMQELAVFDLICTYRGRGHLKARLNPLKSHRDKKEFGFFPPPLKSLQNFKHPPGPPRQVLLQNGGGGPEAGQQHAPPPPKGGNTHLPPRKQALTQGDLGKVFQAGRVLGLSPDKTLREVLSFLENTYCGTLGLQVESCNSEVQNWFFKEFENRKWALTKEQKKDIFYQLAKTEALEKFLHSRFTGAKRFSIEGADALVPMLEYMACHGPKSHIKEMVIGMAHRGRLNVLNTFMNQDTEIIFMEFDGSKALEHFDFDGDVKYHAGYSSVKKSRDGASCNILLAYNPSHLEAVGPVVCGIARARQRVLGGGRQAVLPVLIHGDGAFAGQGVVSETLQLSQLKGFTTGGSLHIIINNQIGFTTNPSDGRSSRHASDLARSIGAPVILVNGDDAESCVRAMDMAFRFRQKFRQDVFIDLICYRRFGHNEGDEPAFTQPLMYQKIKTHPSLMTIYGRTLQEQNILNAEEGGKYYQNHIQHLQKILTETRNKSTSTTLSKEDLKGHLWVEYNKTEEKDFFKPVDTCPLDNHLDKVFEVLTYQPEGFHLHPKIKKLIENRKKMIAEDCLDWALCELAAYGTLCLENHPVRISGQDCQRGTFSHRHAIYFDTQTGRHFSPLSLLNLDKGEVCIYNSSLSEMAVMGFEYGNACADPSFFTLWEAQFGDFCNGAQIIIDQFISSGEEKWMQSCGLVLLLPHGYEGQGPEHSSGRLERWLQLCAQGNLQVCYPSTPANFFHVLRRQVKRSFRKPLVVMTPKSLLRHPEVISSRRDLVRNSEGFQEVLGDSDVKKPQSIEVLVLCSGKVFFDLQKEKVTWNKDLSKTAFVRVEQLYPFPSAALTPYLNGYPRLKKILWVQEEPQNMGAWLYMSHQIQRLMQDLDLKGLSLIPISRKEKASPATGSIQIHQREYQQIMKQVAGHLP